MQAHIQLAAFNDYAINILQNILMKSVISFHIEHKLK